ncbi:hypothetical protein Nepgr_026157 [Nepenthes gracilis]|uniref:Uncharacterized protein n=1 Tax=Nepenthes gracilis TaxID=150966 RepID=A0AAD3Y1T9_NEPGR|nr:hypothetical protein Nepgr_026157 [Nepenthes gracilis]
MAATFKLKFMALLLVYCLLVLGERRSESWVAKACPQYCLQVAYMTCPSSGEKRLPGRCNCCMAPKNCTLHLCDGSSWTCS